MRVSVIIPALNEEEALPRVLAKLTQEWIHEVVVVDNGSTDRTADSARAGGARVVAEPRRGYGSACLRGIAAAYEPEVIVFMDGDHSDVPEDLGRVLEPVLSGVADLVIGSRFRGRIEPGAMPWHQQLGNRIATFLMGTLLRIRCTDLGPLRAIRSDCLRRLSMADADYGWTVEMQLRAAQMGLRVREVPVRYRRRIGTSKISGTVSGSLRAGWKIIATIVRFAGVSP